VECENGWVRIRAGLLLCAGVVVLSGCKSAPAPTPLAQLNAQQMRGYAVFQVRCGACHYDRKDAALHGPAMLGVFKKQSLPSGAPANDERVTAAILHGHGLMPALGDTMDPQDLDDLLAYLHTL
jgi:mono/diheme cytochrome c family protein